MLGSIVIYENEFLNGLFILTASLILASLVHIFFKILLRSITPKTSTEYDELVIQSFRMPVYVSIVLVGLYFALKSFSLNEHVYKIIKNTSISIIFVVWALAVSKFASLFSEKIKESISRHKYSRVDSDVVPFVNNLLHAGLLGVIVLMILDLWGIDITPLLASAGVAGVALAFAAKDMVANLFGGISIFMDRPYRVGDYVLIDNQFRGEVVEIGMRSTKIKTRDNIQITVPNSVMVTQSVINETGYDPKMRIRISLGVAYDSDLDKVEKVLQEIADSHSSIVEGQSSVVRFREFKDSAIRLEFMAYIAFPEERGKIVHELIKEIQKRFAKEKIVIAFPQMDIHLKKDK